VEISKKLVDSMDKRWNATAECSEAFEWRKWQNEIPFIQWPSDWEVKAIPPFAGAVIRYFIRHSKDYSAHVSVYLDCYDQLGCVGQPYWEIHPNTSDDCDRFLMAETKELLQGISDSLAKQMERK
jgi:hypothetical protein